MRGLLAAALLAVVIASTGTSAPAALVDPRAGGLTVGLGEWSVAPEANAIRPGTVTFVVRNGGKVVHGLRIKEESDRSGGDRFKERTIELRPGQTTRFTVTLAPGVYSIECFVEGHDDLGMERRFEVRADAPLVRAPRLGTPGAPRADIAGFAFKPGTIRVKVGATVRWTNRDEAPHTVTAASGGFTSKQLGKGGVYARRFGRAGTYAYLCALHPQMKGRVVVGR
jgi:plastocyanin